MDESKAAMWTLAIVALLSLALFVFTVVILVTSLRDISINGFTWLNTLGLVTSTILVFGPMINKGVK